MNEQHEFETIFAGSSVEANLVRNFLEGEGVSSLLADEFIGTTAPYLAAGGGAGAVKVQVACAEAVRARELLSHHAGLTRPWDE